MNRLFEVNVQKEEEIWKDISGFEGLYQVSNLGRVKSLPKYFYSRGYPQLRKERILNPRCTGKYRNYLAVKFIDGHQYKVHRLVAQAFIPNPNNLPLINHKDENPLNNRVENLEWCTNAYNVKYSAKPLSEEHKDKIRQAHKGKHLSEEHKQKIGNKSREYYSNSSNRQKQSEIITEWWRKRKCKIVENNLKM